MTSTETEDGKTRAVIGEYGTIELRFERSTRTPNTATSDHRSIPPAGQAPPAEDLAAMERIAAERARAVAEQAATTRLEDLATRVVSITDTLPAVAQPTKASETQRRRGIVRKMIKSVAYLRDQQKLLALCEALDSANIRLPRTRRPTRKIHKWAEVAAESQWAIHKRLFGRNGVIAADLKPSRRK